MNIVYNHEDLRLDDIILNILASKRKFFVNIFLPIQTKNFRYMITPATLVFILSFKTMIIEIKRIK